MPKVKWETSEFLEKEAGYLKKLEDSWVSGMYDAGTKTIYLCDKIVNVRHPIFFEIKTLNHEFLHHIFNTIYPHPHSPFDNFLDWLNRVYETGIHNTWHLSNHLKRRFK